MWKKENDFASILSHFFPVQMKKAAINLQREQDISKQLQGDLVKAAKKNPVRARWKGKGCLNVLLTHFCYLPFFLFFF